MRSILHVKDLVKEHKRWKPTRLELHSYRDPNESVQVKFHGVYFLDVECDVPKNITRFLFQVTSRNPTILLSCSTNSIFPEPIVKSNEYNFIYLNKVHDSESWQLEYCFEHRN